MPERRAYPHTTPGRKDTHLVYRGADYALCGRPSNPGHSWQLRQGLTPIADRCHDCATCMEMGNPDRHQPRLWWRT